MHSITSILVACAAPLLLAAASAAQTPWTVNPAGGGDFTDVQAAISSPAVLPGDILLVAPGSYVGFTLDKRLTILGNAGSPPLFFEQVTVQVSGGCTLAGLQFLGLRIQNSTGPVLLDEVRVEGEVFAAPDCHSFRVTSSENVIIQRSVIEGIPGGPECVGPGLTVTGSRVALTDCVVSGGDGLSSAFFTSSGKPGMHLFVGANILLSGTSVSGGDGGTPADFFNGFAGAGASAMMMEFGSECVARGDGSALLQGGVGGVAAVPGADAHWSVSGQGTVTLSGMALDPPALHFTLTVIQPSPAQPFLRITGADDGPGAGKSLDVHGPAGNTQLIMVDVQSMLGIFPAKVDGPLYVNPGAAFNIFPVTTIGQATPISVAFHVPNDAGLIGATAVFQGFAQGLGAGGTWLAGNPALVVVR
jgi:hypothetical protein